MEENIVEQIRVDKLNRIHGFRFLAVAVNKLMVSLGKRLYKWGYLSEITETDALTGLFNRNFYERWIDIIVSMAERADVGLAIVVIDVNFLKKKNDLEGHAAGDRMLKRMARSLVKHARKSDVIIRLGGDEFLAVLWDCGYENASKIMNKQVSRLKKKEIYFSFGIAEWKKGKKITEVVHEADQKMYGMKAVDKRK